MENNSSKGKVEELNEVLNSRTRYSDPMPEHSLVPQAEAVEVEGEWQGEKIDEMLKYERRKPESNKLMKKIFIGAIGFFILTLGVAAYIFFGGRTFVSSKNVDIRVLGPASVSAGDILELGITVDNKNNADLEPAILSIQYPAGTRSAGDTTESLTYVREELGTIDAGREAVYTGRAVIFGERGEVKQIKISIEYKISGSNATFYKDKIYEIVIGDSPVTMTVSAPREITSGENFITTITISANSAEILRQVMVRAEYPYGYSIISSEPSAQGDSNVWPLGDFSPGSKKTITITGRLVGENEEERTFRFYAGVADSNEALNFKTNLVSVQETLAIRRPSLSAILSLNGDSASPYIAPAGQSIAGSLRLTNNLPDKVINPKIEVTISGPALDKLSVQASNEGFYDSSNNRITWNPTNSSGARELLPGEEEKVSFSFASLSELESLEARDITLIVAVSGTSVGEGRGETLSVKETRQVKIASEVRLSSKTLYSKGAFSNSGPLPPKAETETTYTLVFTVGNTQADVNNAQLTAVLGQNVEWLDKISGDGSVVYDPNTKTLSWDLGTLSSGSGFSTIPRELSVQVKLKPSLSQVGTTPVLATNISLTGFDIFTNKEIRVNNSALTTKMPSDPQFVQGDDVVVR